MKGFLIVVGLLYGAYYYASNHFKFEQTLEYASRHKGASWAGPVDYYVGLVYYQRSEYPMAQKAFQQLLTDHPTHYHAARGLILLSSAAEYNSDWPAAKSALATYLEQYPNGKDVEIARKRLEMLRYKHGP